jgi:hypothetical protein
VLTGKKGGLLPARVLTVCFAKDNRLIIGKLDPRVLKCIFVGYEMNYKGYVWWSPTERRLIVSMDVHFREMKPY